jgi:hypothetical protein
VPFFYFCTLRNSSLQMKKNIVLFVLFVLPIVAYLFFASGVNSFTKLPVVTANTADFGNWSTLDGDKITLNDKVTILGFAGTDLLIHRGNIFNLNQKIYQRYHKFKDVQFVVICPTGTEKDAKKVVDALGAFTDMEQWRFVFASPEEINTYYDQLQLVEKLDEKLGTPKVYIIDKKRNLRGRKLVKNTKEGYNTFHPSELSNEMLDDFKVILYEYRAALKKNKNASRKI